MAEKEPDQEDSAEVTTIPYFGRIFFPQIRNTDDNIYVQCAPIAISAPIICRFVELLSTWALLASCQQECFFVW